MPNKNLGTSFFHNGWKTVSTFALIFLATQLQSCRLKTTKNLRSDYPSQLADIEIDELSEAEYDRYELILTPQNSSEQPTSLRSKKTNGTVRTSVKPGTYLISLQYYFKEQKVSGSDLCLGDLNNEKQTLKPGKNKIILQICGQNTELVSKAPLDPATKDAPSPHPKAPTQDPATASTSTTDVVIQPVFVP